MSSPFTRAMAVAVAIHIVIVGSAALFAQTIPQSLPAPQPSPWMDIALVEPSAFPPAPPPPRKQTPDEPPAAGPALAKHVPPPKIKSPSGEPGVEGDGPGAVLDPSGTDPEGIPSGGGSTGTGPGAGGKGPGSGRPGVNIGLDRSMTWLWTRPEVPAPKPRPASTTGGLQEALDAHDRKMGLGFGGPVVSAFHAAAASPSAPQHGRARFEAIIDASGRATSVRVLSVDGDMAAWEAVATRVLQSLRAHLLRVPDGHGIAVVVDVRARYQMPSGAEPGKAVQMEGAGARFDVSDIGARPAHNVAVHIVTERRL